MPKPVVLLPSSNLMTQEAIRSQVSGSVIAACDFYIDGIEGSTSRVFGFESGDIFNIDHHAPVRWMARKVSSTNLAILGVKNGELSSVSSVVINHVDCDSVLSAAIVAHLLPPDEVFGKAAIAADHTGEENEIADLLQMLSPKRDFDFSLKNLSLLLDGKVIDREAQAAMNERRRRRDVARDAVSRGLFSSHGGVYWADMGEEIDGEFFPALLPDAKVIVTSARHDKNPENTTIKVRLGLAAPEGTSIHNLNIRELDPFYGGRWNAGSNKRGGGSSISAENYASYISKKLSEHTARKRSL